MVATTVQFVERVGAVAGQIAGDVANVASRIQAAFDDQAAGELRASIRNVADLSATVRGVVREHASDIDSLSGQLRSAVLTLNRTAARVELTAQRIDSATTSDQVRSLVDNLSVASGELRQAALRVRELTTGLASTQARADAFLANGDSVLRKLNRGEGSLGLMLNDPSVNRHTDSLVLELRRSPPTSRPTRKSTSTSGSSELRADEPTSLSSGEPELELELDARGSKGSSARQLAAPWGFP